MSPTSAGEARAGAPSILLGNRPAVFRGAAADWPAMAWTFAKLRDHLGEARLPVHTGRWRASSWRVHRDGPSAKERAATFFDALLSGTCDRYLAGPEIFRAAPDLRQDLAFPSVGPLAVDVAWIGPAGTVTPAHFDRAPNLYAQLTGRKRWRLWKPGRPMRPRFAGLGYSFSGLDVEGEVEADRPGPGRPSSPGLAPPDLDVVLEPGDVLTVPIGWWHRVDTVTDAIAVNRWWRLHPGPGAASGLAGSRRS